MCFYIQYHAYGGDLIEGAYEGDPETWTVERMVNQGCHSRSNPHLQHTQKISIFFVKTPCKKFSTEIPLDVFPQHTVNKKFPRLRY